MRVTDSMRTTFWQSNIDSNLTNLTSVQRELATGKQINQPSDDPAGAAEAMAIGQSMVENNQYQRNVTAAQSTLSATSGALSSVSNILLTARQIASQGANSTDTSNYTALASQIDALTNQLISVSNTSIGGKYIFSGTQTDKPPYTNYPVPSSTPVAADNNSTLGSFAPGNYYVSYSFTYANGGESPVTSATQVTVATNNDSIDLSNVAALPAGATGVNVYVGTSSTNMTLAQNFATAGPFTVTTAPVPAAAPAPSAPIVTYSGNSGTTQATIGPNTTVQTNTPGNTIFNPIFQMLGTLKQSLLNAAATPPVSGALDAISATITTIDTNSSNVVSTNSTVGAKINMLKTTSQQITTQTTQYTQSLSNIQDVDLASAYVQLQSDQNVYQASLAATAKAFQYNLVNYLQ